MNHPARALAAFALLSQASCGSDTGVKVYNTEPGVTVTAPADREVFTEGEVIEFLALVDDNQDAPEDLRLTWTSDLDGVLRDDATADGTGKATYTTANLSAGTHVVELIAVDSAAASGSDFVTVVIEPLPEAPVIDLVAPGLGDSGVEGEAFEFIAEVSDAQDDPADLAVDLESDLDGIFCEPVPDNSGVARCWESLTPGEHLLTFTVTDSSGLSSSATAYFEVLAGTDVDDDLDGYTENEGDCDDGDPDIHPGAPEIQDGLDNDCDGDVDEGTDAFDDDGDGFTETAGDCDDGDASVNPDAVESCDGVDEDCDGDVDEGTNCVDDDGDGYAELDGDCDDDDPTAWPGAPEVLDGVDNNCDGLVDDTTVAFDDDGDCYCELAPCTGSINGACPSVDGGDCNDANTLIGPHMAEQCDGLDNDCDLAFDEDDALDVRAWYADADGDSFGDPAVFTEACSAPAGHVANDDDCDDTSSAIKPTAVEVCDLIDNDCDASIDEGVTNSYWFDGDADGYGNAAAVTSACSAPAGYVPSSTDCDDGDATVNPGARELCNGVDDDCDAAVDEDEALDAATWYRDRDADGYGDPIAVAAACAPPSGYVADHTDCNDYNNSVNPGATEVCNSVDDDCDTRVDNGTECYDDDLDYYTELEGDCDDANPYTYPGAPEIGDGVDNDCDGDIDEGTSAADDDGDGFSEAGGDCDDGDPAVFPGADELCNGVDDDCDLTVDEDDALDALEWFVDGDGDGFGDIATTLIACDAPLGFADNADDCDDAAPGVNPDATEVCDGVDNDCDVAIDESLLITSWFDGDGDLYGDAALPDVGCTVPPGHVLNDDDCDDARSGAYPFAPETCNGLDDDCDAAIDESAVDAAPYWRDADGDSFGLASDTVNACGAPAGYVANDDDCNDSNNTVYPGAPEVCDGLDRDCDGVADDGTSCFDDDGDGYTEDDGDCNDSNPFVYPGAVEFLDGLDNDCNGAIDDGTDGFDDDGDGFSESSGDCDDTDPAVFPGAIEWCDGVDNDCDVAVDEADAVDATTWYRDSDGDGFGDPLGDTIACWNPAGYVANDDDCDDGSAAVKPGATEICNGVDDDCDASIDEGALTTWYADADTDGYGDPASTTLACSNPGGHVLDDNDCDDTNGAVHPGATEVCNGLDDDCSGGVDTAAVDAPTWFLDGDGDGWGGSTSAVSCAAPSGYVADDGDCRDTDATAYPGAPETCDGVDDNCDGTADEGVTTRSYRDLDGDGYGDAGTYVDQCAIPGGYVANADDCNDADPAINPLTVWYRDADGDGFGRVSSTKTQCFQPSAYVLDATDCDDNDLTAFPGAPEVCDGDDDDCDGVDDEPDAAGCDIWYLDADGDGQGAPGTGLCLCAADPGTNWDSANDNDCGDNDNDVYLGATGWYSTPNANGDYDYDCDGSEEKKFVAQFECTALVVTCTLDASGWDGPIPGCGATATWAEECKLDGGAGGPCVSKNGYGKVQTCR